MIKRIIFALFLLQIIKFERIVYENVYKDLYIIIYEQFFLISSNSIICKRNNTKIILLTIFYVFSLLFFSYIKQ